MHEKKHINYRPFATVTAIYIKIKAKPTDSIHKMIFVEIFFITFVTLLIRVTLQKYIKLLAEKRMPYSGFMALP